MPHNRSHRPAKASRESLVLLIYLGILWLAGGASRADTLGQPIVMFATWCVLFAVIFGWVKTDWSKVRPLLVLLASFAALIAAQLIPLPPGIWASLPGRDVIVQTALAVGEPQPWRPITISPAATVNSLFSLTVPLAILAVSSTLSFYANRRVLIFILGAGVFACLLGLIEFSGANFDNPLVNDPLGAVTGNFANQNHFALFLAFGVLVALAWGLQETAEGQWRVPVVGALIIIFLLVILATGSRSGVGFAALALILGLLISRKGLAARMRGLTGGQKFLAIGALAGLVSLVIVASIYADRAISITRAVELTDTTDMRLQILPVLLALVARYFPFGSGFGAFDPVYRITEPDALLGPKYINHAHNDFLEVAIDGGLPGILLIVVAAIWWLSATLKTVRHPTSNALLARVGSAIILLTAAASLVDYPVRTPFIAGLITLSAVWLYRFSRREVSGDGSASNRHRSSGTSLVE